MSVENKIRELMSQKLDEAFPGMGKNKEESAPMQGSSEKPAVETLPLGSKAGANMRQASAPLAAGVGAKEAQPMKQGSSEDADVDQESDEETAGRDAASATSKDSTLPAGQGPGEAPNFKKFADILSMDTKGQVQREEIEAEAETEELQESEVEAEEIISEDEYNALSDEEKSEYELVEDEIEEAKMEDEEEDEEDEDEEEKMKMAKVKEELAKDVENLFAEETELSEEFKSKAASLFEAVVTARVAHEVEQLQDVLAEEAANTVVQMQEALVNKIDSYLSYVAEQWLEQNQVAIENGLRNEITEDFIAGLRVLFTEHYIDVPEEKYDVLGEMQAQIDELTESVNTKIEDAISLAEQLVEAKREIIVNKVSSDLAQTEVEKLRGLVEDVVFESEELFEEKVTVVKANFFPKSNATSPIQEDVENSTEEVSDTFVNKYAEMISRTKF